MRRATLMGAGIIVVALVAAYANGYAGPFIFDDVPAIVENPTIRDLATALAPPSDRGLPVTGRPVVNLSLAINYALGGLEPRGYHVANVVFHVAAALLLFGGVRRTVERLKGDARSTIGAAIAVAVWWALHPLQTAAVTYTVQRAEVLVSVFYLLTWYGLVRAVAVDAGTSRARWKARGWLALSVSACGVGMATKEVMVSAPIMMLLYDYAFVTGRLSASWRQRWKYYGALAATWAILVVLMAQTGTRAGTAGFELGVGPGAYALKQCEAVVHYLRLAFWPTPLVFDYGGMVLVAHVAEALPQVVAIGALLTATAAALWRWPRVGFAGAWFFGLLAPSSSVVPLADTMFEHRMYLALAGVAGLSVWCVQEMLGRRANGVFVVVGIAFAGLTVERNKIYRSEISLWQDTAAKRPDSVRARYTLGAALFATGRTDEAFAQYRAALTLDPTSPETHNNVGNAFMKSGRIAEARPHYEAALRARPSAETFNNYGNALLRLGEPAAAREQYEAALRLRPDLPDAHNNLGNILAQSGDFAAAAEHYEAALRTNPNLADAQANLGNVRAQSGKLDEAIAHYRSALRLRPDFADARFNLATALAQQRQWREAITHYERVLEIRPDYPGAKQRLEEVRVYQDVLGK